MPAVSDPTGRQIRANSLLAVQFERFKIAPLNEGKARRNEYRLIAGGKNLNSTWFTNRPKRLTGEFLFDDITGKRVWEGLYANENPNSSLSSNGRTIVFETGFFKKRANGNYVSRIKLNGRNRDEITGGWENASMVVDATSATYNFGSTFANSPGSGGDFETSIITGGYPDFESSCDSSDMGFLPLMIANTTDVKQVVNVTMSSELASNISVISLSEFNSAGGTLACNYPGSAIQSQNFAIGAGQTWFGGIIAGGADSAGSGLNTNAEHNLAFSGGTNPKVYYDLNLSVNGLNNNFDFWQLQYDGTGGVGSTGQQNGLVAVAVTPTSLSSSGATTFTLTNQVLSPYSSSWTAPVTWYKNEAIGFAFL
jgi:hypothetical protein